MLKINVRESLKQEEGVRKAVAREVVNMLVVSVTYALKDLLVEVTAVIENVERKILMVTEA